MLSVQISWYYLSTLSISHILHHLYRSTSAEKWSDFRSLSLLRFQIIILYSRGWESLLIDRIVIWGNLITKFSFSTAPLLMYQKPNIDSVAKSIPVQKRCSYSNTLQGLWGTKQGGNRLSHGNERHKGKNKCWASEFTSKTQKRFFGLLEILKKVASLTIIVRLW